MRCFKCNQPIEQNTRKAPGVTPPEHNRCPR